MTAAAAGALCASGHQDHRSLALGAVAAAGLALGLCWRIAVEERCLAASDDWQDYAEVVRYRLVPGLW